MTTVKSTPRSAFIVFLAFLCLGAPNSQVRQPRRLSTIPVRVNHKTGLFLVDTGADRSIIDTTFALSLDLRQTGVANIRTNYSTELRPIVIVDDFQFGDKASSGVSLVAMDLSLISRIQSMPLAGVRWE